MPKAPIPPPPPIAKARARLAATVRHHGPDDPRLPELRRDLAAEQLADYVRRIVDQAPPLTSEQRDRIAALLRPVADHSGDAA